MSSKASSLSSRVRERISQALPDVESLVVGAVGLAQSGSRTEARFWEARLAQALGRLLDGGHAGAVLAALDRINQMDGTAYGALLEALEHAAEEVRIPASALRGQAAGSEPAEPLYGLMVSAPIVAWTRFSIPARALPAPVAAELSRIWQEEVLAPGVKFQMQSWLYSLDQLPHDFSDMRKLTRRMATATANGSTLRSDFRSMPEAPEMLADARFLLGSVVASGDQPIFRWQLPGEEQRSRQDCLDAWNARIRPLIEPLLPGCGFESLLPDAYHANLRESDRLVRVWGVKAAVNYLVHSLDIEPTRIRASVASCGNTQVDEYRIGFSLGDSDDVVQGVVWPLLGPESDADDPPPVQQIRRTLQEVGVNDIRVWNSLMEPEFCEDCASPFYPNRSGELVHVQMPEEAETASTQFH